MTEVYNCRMATTRKLADRLLLMRRELDLNQEDLALRSGIDSSYISSLERKRRDNPSLDVIESLAKALGVRPEYLAGWTDDVLGEGDIVEGRVVYQTVNQGEYRALQDLLDIWPELTEEDRRFVLDLAMKLGRTKNARIVE